VTKKYASTERPAVRVGRWLARAWPFARGKGPILRAVRKTLPTPRAVFQVEKSVLAEANIDDYLGREYYLNGLRRQPSFQLSRALIRPDDILVDVGANVGYWVLGAARRLGPGGHAHAFEPSPDLFQVLQDNVRLNHLSCVSCHLLALSDQEGRVRFRPRPDNTAHGALSPVADPDAILVDATTLDQFSERHALARLDFLKLDVEGAEELVLRGATSVLSRRQSPVLILELGGGLAERFGSSTVQVKELLSAFDYATYKCDGRRLRPVTTAQQHESTEDFFAIKQVHLSDRPELAKHIVRE